MIIIIMIMIMIIIIIVTKTIERFSNECRKTKTNTVNNTVDPLY